MNEYNDKVNKFALALIQGFLPFCDRTELVVGDGLNNGLFTDLFPNITSDLTPDSLVLITPLYVDGLSIENGVRTKLLHPYLKSTFRVVLDYRTMQDDLYLGMAAGMHVHAQLYKMNDLNPC